MRKLSQVGLRELIDEKEIYTLYRKKKKPFRTVLQIKKVLFSLF
jgi:hypothetical protein